MSAEWWSVILQAITVFAVAFAAFQLMLHSRQMHRDLEMAYVERYWSLMDERSVKFVWSQQASELGKQAMGYANVAVWKNLPGSADVLISLLGLDGAKLDFGGEAVDEGTKVSLYKMANGQY